MEACYLRISCIIKETQNEYVKSEGSVAGLDSEVGGRSTKEETRGDGIQ